MGFKENLRALREKAGKTQSELATKAGVPFRSYQNWETGSREPRIAALVALAETLGVSVDELVRESPSRVSQRAGRPRKSARN